MFFFALMINSDYSLVSDNQNHVRPLRPSTANWRGGVVVRASASQLADFLSRVISKDFKKWYPQLPCLALSIKRDSVQNKPEKLLAVSLGKAFNGTPPSLCGRQVAYPYFPELQL